MHKEYDSLKILKVKDSLNITKQKKTDIKNKLVVTGRGRDKIGLGIKKHKIFMYEINELQGFIVQHREYSQYFITTLNRV